MEIAGLTLAEISGKIKHFVTIYLIDSSIEVPENGLFEESVVLHGEEVRHLIPPEHHSRFDDSHKFNAASGHIRFKSRGYQFKGKEYIVMLLYDNEQAYFLYLQEQNGTGNNQDILLVDFLKQGNVP